MSLFRPTLRLRMALLYGGLVLIVGVSVLLTALLLITRAISEDTLFDNAQNVTFKGTPHSSQEVVDKAQHEAISKLLHVGLLYFAIVVVVGATGGYLLAKQALRPIARLTKTAKQMSTETLDQRINLGGPDDELRELADTFDDMLGRLDAAFESQRLFVANASHELRTPLTVIKTELEVTLADPDADVADLRRMGNEISIATDRAQRLVSSLLTLARLQAVEAGELEVMEDVDLAILVPGVIDAVRLEATGKGIVIEANLEKALTTGDPRLLERLIGNLVENAIRHNVPNGWLRVTTGQTAEKVWLHVANGGTVIENADVDSLFEPFRRGGRVRTATRGAGLGLAIVRLIVDAHGGKMQAKAPPFGGLAIRIELPRAGTPGAATRMTRAGAGPRPGGGPNHRAPGPTAQLIAQLTRRS
jgi:signal transduction histidine kinase